MLGMEATGYRSTLAADHCCAIRHHPCRPAAHRFRLFHRRSRHRRRSLHRCLDASDHTAAAEPSAPPPLPPAQPLATSRRPRRARRLRGNMRWTLCAGVCCPNELPFPRYCVPRWMLSNHGGHRSRLPEHVQRWQQLSTAWQHVHPSGSRVPVPRCTTKAFAPVTCPGDSFIPRA